MPARGRQPFKRSDRVADSIRQILADVFMRRVPHHGLEGITVTAVHVTDDLQHARVYYRVLDSEKRADAEKSLAESKWMIRKELGHELHLKFTPDLHFEFDDSLEYGSRIEGLLKKVRTEASEEE